MPRTIALIPVNTQRTALGLPSRVGEMLGDRTVLGHTVERAAAIRGVEAVVLVHPRGQTLPRVEAPVLSIATDGWDDPHVEAIRAARKWSPAAWRGGLGGATVFDELLPAGPLVEAMKAHGAASAILLGADWPVLDPAICAGVLGLHLEAPETMRITFSQAPPGLAGVAVSLDLLDEMARGHGTFAQALRYNPRLPTPDPIGRDVCFQIDPRVRSDVRRFVYDTQRGIAAVCEKGGYAKPQAEIERRHPEMPQQVTLELTPRRLVSGPITPQHHVAFDRGDMPIDAAERIVRQLGDMGDTVLTLGGLGDALLHPQWGRVVEAARDAGVWSVCVQTDLLCNDDTLHQLLQLPIDVTVIRLNADCAATYERVMGADHFDAVIKRVEWLYNHRGRSGKRPGAGLPWLVPSLVKTADTLGDLEGYFNRWMHYAGHAMVAPATSGCGLMPELSPVPMASPQRRACRQLGSRMTIHSDGRVALCDQDWLGRAALGETATMSLREVWSRVNEPVAAHAAGRWDDLPLCRGCVEWHRP
jgi:hypothetical protein